MVEEVAWALARHGLEGARTEVLTPVPGLDPRQPPLEPWRPLPLEAYARLRVAQGVYEQFITQAEHLTPLAQCLQSAAFHRMGAAEGGRP